MITLQIPTSNGTLCCEVVVLGAPKTRDENLPAVYPDEYLEHWAEVWRRNRALMPHVSLLAFLVDPRAVLHHYLSPADRPEPDGPEPLLPAQRAVAERLDQEDHTRETVEEIEEALVPPEAELRGRRLIEPLHHHAHEHRHRHGFFPKREGSGNG